MLKVALIMVLVLRFKVQSGAFSVVNSDMSKSGAPLLCRIANLSKRKE